MLRRVRLRAICSGFRTEIFEKISRPENFAFEIGENAPKSVPPDDVQPCHDPKKSPSTVSSVGMLPRVRLQRISDRNFRNFFAARARKILRSKSREIQRAEIRSAR